MREVLTPPQFFILAVLLRCPMYPYAVRQEIIEASGRKVFPRRSSLHWAIESLIKFRYIEECYNDPFYWLKARRGRVYMLTDSGKARINRELDTYSELINSARLWQLRNEALEAKQNGLKYDHVLLAKYPLPPRKDSRY